jgi:hypothetical protein
MGIFKYNTWIRNTFPNCIINKKKLKFDHVYIDVNYLLHLSMYQTTNNEEFFKKLFTLIDYIIINCYSTKTIMFSVDGASPYSKIILQRKRRFNNVSNINMDNLNSLHLTPGTDLMNSIESKLNEYVNKKKNWFKFRKIKFIISSPNIPGEGEIKIIKKIKKIAKKNKNESHLIIGNDADLIVISMACTYSKKIYIMLKNKYENIIISVEKLIDDLSNSINKKINKKIYNKKLRTDFSIISILNGNDYIPKLKFSNNEILWYAYLKTKNKRKDYLINKGIFNKIFLKEFITNLLVIMKPRYNKFNIKEFNKKYIENYLQALLWCNNMYKNGCCSMFDFMCHEVSPKPIDVLHYLLINKNINLIIPKSNTKPINTSIYPLLLLPKKASDLIPNKFKSILNTKLNYLYKNEECEFCNSINKKIKIKKSSLDNDFSINDKILNEIKELNSQLKTHKKTHKFKFNINDINYIVSLQK